MDRRKSIRIKLKNINSIYSLIEYEMQGKREVWEYFQVHDMDNKGDNDVIGGITN